MPQLYKGQAHYVAALGGVNIYVGSYDVDIKRDFTSNPTILGTYAVGDKNIPPFEVTVHGKIINMADSPAAELYNAMKSKSVFSFSLGGLTYSGCYISRVKISEETTKPYRECSVTLFVTGGAV